MFAPDAQYRMKAHREAGTDPGELQRGAQKAGLVAPAVLAVIVFVAVSSAEQIGRVANPSVDELCGENAPGPDGPAPVVEHLVNHIERSPRRRSAWKSMASPKMSESASATLSGRPAMSRAEKMDDWIVPLCMCTRLFEL